MTRIVGVDSMVVIYAGLVPRKSGTMSEELRELGVRSQILLHMHRKDTIVLPTIAVSEVLIPLPAAQRGILLTELWRRFLCPSFDLRAADIAANLWSLHKRLSSESQYESRHVLRADVMIVAAAKSAGATTFYSHDKKCLALAAKVMDSHDLPKNDPNDMFLRRDVEHGEV